MASNSRPGSSSGSVNSQFQSSNKRQKESTPLWAYVTLVSQENGGDGGNRSWKCNYCNNQYNGSYSRVKFHLLRISGKGIAICPKVDDSCLGEMRKAQEEAENRTKPRHVPLPTPTESLSPLCQRGSTPIQSEHNQGKRRAINTIERAFQQGARDNLTAEIARMFYSAGLSFNLARNPYFISAFQYAANNVIPGFKPPGYNALRSTLLQKERANVEKQLESIKGTWNHKGVSIVTDGWTDVQRRPLINFMAVSDGSPMFLKAIDATSEYKDRFYMADLIKKVVEEVGPHKVVQVITDNAPVCKSAGKMVEDEYPHIFWTPCVVHTLNLALKNICAAKNTEANEIVYGECCWITEVRDDAVFIRTFIMNHSMRLAMFNEFVPLKLLAIAETRFASTIVMLKRFKLIKTSLRTLVISEEWNAYRDDDVGKAATVKDIILNDLWWEKVDYILSFTKPNYDMLRFADTDRPTLHLIYEMWDSMIEQIKESIYKHERKSLSEYSSFYEVVYNIIIDRWTKSATPLHCLAHSLNPRYYTTQWLEGGLNRVSPHRDAEISTERKKCIRRMFPDEEERKLVMNEFSKCSGCSDEFSFVDSIQDRWVLEPKAWWSNHGADAPKLQGTALKLLNQPCSSSCCERNWSTYSFVHSLKRNKMLPKRTENLVFVHSNLRLLSRKSEKYSTGESKLWDISGDCWEIDDVENLEVASLSIDEPILERELIGESGGVNEDEED
ncbi:putative transcriptional regulator tpeD [Prosopis cineraria]|uniref:putative transcriptional regulator tpeD n=1 Tax=Prosopis cineraria TaxID=364024 RepID=UPI00240F8A7A|nr:putative transcriptional regulator tpeD [Prosopis cineraria]